MGGFVQVMRFTTSKMDEVDALSKRMLEEQGDSMRATRVLVTQDRDADNTYLVIAEFASYEEAMENSEDPTTDRFAGELAALFDGPPVFTNLDIREVITPR